MSEDKKMSAGLQGEQHQNTNLNSTAFMADLSIEEFADYANFLKQFLKSFPDGQTSLYKDGEIFTIRYLSPEDEYFTFSHWEDGEEEIKHVDQ